MIPLALLTLTLFAPPQAQEARARAEQLARQGAHREALEQFQAIAAANPDDVEARVWIGRLHQWMGHPDRAVAVYESVIATHPQHLEALLGLGDSLIAVDRLDEAASVLNRAEALAADDTRVLAAQARLHDKAGRGRLADAYYRKAIALQPNDADLRRAHDASSVDRAHRVDGGYYFEDFNTDAPQTHAGLVRLNLRAADPLRVTGGVHVQDKFDRTETRAGAGVEWRPLRELLVRGSAWFAGDAQIFASSDFDTGVEYAYRRLHWLADYRALDFDTAFTWMLSPGVRIAATDTVHLTLQYHYTSTSYDDASFLDDASDGVTIEGTARLTPRLELTAGYLRGFAGLTFITSDLLDSPDANSLRLAVAHSPRPRTTIGALFEQQWRPLDVRVTALMFTLTRRF